MDQTLINRVRQCPNLPTLPTIALQVLDLAQHDEADIAEIARVISRDAALASKILKTVNSSFYGRAQAVAQVSQALVILGLQAVKTLVLGFSLVSTLKGAKPSGFSHLDYWRRSIYAATSARTIASSVDIIQSEECFLVGLLQDIGMLILDQVARDDYSAVCGKAMTHLELVQLEKTMLGVTHSEVSGLIADTWKLPPLLAEPMRMHHDSAAVEDPALRELVNVAHAAGLCAEVFMQKEPAQQVAEVRDFCRNAFSMADERCDSMLSDIAQKTREVASLFEIKLGETADFDAILRKANETLVELTLRSQQQAMNLEAQNQKLKEASITDALTGLANRGRFDQFLEEQMALATRHGRRLSLLMMDLDKFKSINDTRGHQAGDQVLRTVGKLLRMAARSNDLAARYGGEELVLVLPETTRQTAAAIAESIRRAVAAKPLPTDSGPVPVTVSIGVATFEPGSPLRQASHLLKAADMSVYAAKSGGRNCVKVFSLPAAQAPAA